MLLTMIVRDVLISQIRVRTGGGQPQGLPLQRVCRGLFSYQSFMSVVTDTTNHENGGWSRRSRVAEVGGWIPAYAGMTVWWLALVVTGGFQTRPYECRLPGGYFQRNRSCRLVTCTPRDENGERRLAEEFDRQWRFEPAEESVTCGPSSTPSCCHSVMSEHAYQLEYMWGRPLPAIPDGGEGNASVVRAMRRVGCPQKVDHRVRAHR